MPSSSLNTMSRVPPVRANLSRAPLGITIWPLSFIVTEPQMFFPFGAGGMEPIPSAV